MLIKTEMNTTLAKLSKTLTKVAQKQNMPEPFLQALQLIHDKGVDANLDGLKLESTENFNRDQTLIAKAIKCFSELKATYDYLCQGGQPVLVWTHKKLGTIETSTEDYILVRADQINTIMQAVTGILRPDEEHWLDFID